MSKKIVIILLAVSAILALLGYFFVGRALWNVNIKLQDKTAFIEIPTDASFEDVKNIFLQNNYLIDINSFDRVATILGYKKDKVPGGRYKLQNGWSNKDLITTLRSGNQTPSQVVINNIRKISDLAGKASRYFETDSLGFLTHFLKPETPSEYNLNQDNFLTLFIPNTYEMFWTTTPEKFVTRMAKEYDRFWTDERVEKLKKWNLSKTDAYILASIVEKESNYDPERPTIAGVYLNRLKVGEKLQADPTVVYAVGEFDLKRVLYSHLEYDSPYNTYMYNGLPPGPICMPSLASLEAVINAEDHEYMFFCAKADNSGIHAFAVTYADHVKNANAFAAWMNKNNIR
ncbi:MAG TPA: endolytic transglycosylase MltG [Saprospiraceae bacterium]|nr:endolytic transglycosylase MltG [Saprospiraceae bacterium]